MQSLDPRVVIGQPRQLRSHPSDEGVRLVGPDARVGAADVAQLRVEDVHVQLVAVEVVPPLQVLARRVEHLGSIVLGRAPEHLARRAFERAGASDELGGRGWGRRLRRILRPNRRTLGDLGTGARPGECRLGRRSFRRHRSVIDRVRAPLTGREEQQWSSN